MIEPYRRTWPIFAMVFFATAVCVFGLQGCVPHWRTACEGEVTALRQELAAKTEQLRKFNQVDRDGRLRSRP